MEKTKSYSYDPAKLTEDQRRQLETYNQQKEQFQALKDIADMVQELVSIADDNTKNTSQLEALGAVLTDAREQLVALNAKEAPEAPEVAKPIVEAVAKLEKALKSLSVTPQVNVAAPNVNVDAPDLTTFNKILRDELPKAFEKAIKLIPKTDIKIPEPKDRWDEVLDQLQSIDTATRMKPLPGSMTISNLNEINVGLIAGVDYDYIDVQQTSTTVETYAYKNGGVGGTAVRTIVITYTDATKTDIDYVEFS